LKAVFDTNIFVSALAIPGGQAERAVDLVIDARVRLCISKDIIHEVLDVLAHELVAPRRRLAVLDDEPDNRLLECAVAAHAHIIVTGDRAMLNLKKYEQIRILSLRQFVDEIAGSGS
jgi:uncharacterized protein